MAVNLEAEAFSIAPAGTQLNLLGYSIVGVNTATGNTVTGRTVSGAFLDEEGRSADSGRRIQMIFDMDVFPDVIGTDDAWEYTVTVTDTAGGKAVAYCVVAPGHAALSVSADKYGTAVGMIATGTKTKPKFEVAESYSSYFHGPIYDKNGNEILAGSGGSSGGAELIEHNTNMSRTIPTSTDVVNIICDTRKNASPGLYLVNFNVRWFKQAGGDRMVFIRLGNANGATYGTGVIPGDSNMSPGQNVAAIIPVQSGQWIEIVLYQSSGSNITAAAYCQAARIGNV